MSKGFNMTGWRLGFVVGNPLVVKAYADVKDNTDSGQFLAVQEACVRLGPPADHAEDCREVLERMTGLVEVLNRHGFAAKKPKGSFFLYVKAPKAGLGRDGRRVAFEKAETFSQWLITEKLISTVPDDVSLTPGSASRSSRERRGGRTTGAGRDRQVGLGGSKFEF